MLWSCISKFSAITSVAFRWRSYGPKNILKLILRFLFAQVSGAPRLANGKIRANLATVVSMLFSHLGLCLLVAGYAVLGAFTFSALELPYERLRKGHVENDTEMVMIQVREWTLKQDVLRRDEFMKKAESVLKAFEKQMVFAITMEGYDEANAIQKEQWTFTGALLYSFTVITTIGYGNIVPKTDAGKAVTIAYATIGIPLMLMCLAKIAETLARFFTFMYFKVCCAYCRWKEKRRVKLRRAATMTAKNYLGVAAVKRGLSMRSTGRSTIDRNRRGGSFRRDVPKKQSVAGTLPKQSKAHDLKWETSGGFRSLPPDRRAPVRRQNTVANVGPKKSVTVKKTDSIRSSPAHQQSIYYHPQPSTLPSSLKTGQQPAMKRSPAFLSPHKPGCDQPSDSKRTCKCGSVCWSPNIQQSPTSPEDNYLGPSRYTTYPKSHHPTDSGSISERGKQPLTGQLSTESIVPHIVVSDPNHNEPKLKTSSSTSRLADMTSDEEDTTGMGDLTYTSRTQDTIVMLSEDRSMVTIASKRSADSDEKSLRSISRSIPRPGEEEKMPVSVGILTLVAFVLGGAILFSIWEKWAVFDAAYFCFITLTTIGFGDMVPGASVSHDRQDILIINTVYLLVGMALIAMCFKLMQDDVVQKTRWLGQKIGLLAREVQDDWWDWEDSDEESDEDEEEATVVEDKHTMSSGSSNRREEDSSSARGRR